jgi:hypothetical protein
MARFKSALYLIAAAGLLAAAGAAQAAVVPDDGKLDFAVLRDGEKIGSYKLSFEQKADRLDVKVKTRIKVKLAFITLYHFDHDGHEVWQDGKLVQMETKTDDDGTDHKLKVAANGAGALRVICDGEEMVADANAIPASLWNPAFIQNGNLMDSLVGKPLNVNVTKVGEETVSAKGRSIKAHHYSLTGDLARELWYDETGMLVRMTLVGEDGSQIQYVLD